MLYPVRIFDANGKLKQELSVQQVQKIADEKFVNGSRMSRVSRKWRNSKKVKP